MTREFDKQALNSTIVDFFEQTARRNAAMLQALIDDGRFVVTPDRWRFTLPELFAFMQQRYEHLKRIGYTEFRRGIYDSEINATVKKVDAEVIIDTNLEHTDRSIYALVWGTEPQQPRKD